jgi:hypothetical protein
MEVPMKEEVQAYQKRGKKLLFFTEIRPWVL